MELQSSLIETESPIIEAESPTVTLKNGTLYSRSLVKDVMYKITQLQTSVPNGALLLLELVTKCKNPEHRYFDGCKWKLAELGFLESDGEVIPSTRDILLSALTGEGLDIGFESPIQC
jgi:hypothetical protein